MRIAIFGLPATAALFILLMSCSKNNSAGRNDEEVTPVVTPYKALFTDTLFQNGFTLGNVQDGVPGVATILSYGGITGANPVWSIGQWNNYNNNLKDASFNNASPVYKYSTTHGTGIKVDTQSGTVQLKLNTESEYGYSDVCPVNPRRANDKWPHLLLAYDVPQEQLLKIADKKEVVMKVDFTIDEIENKIPAGTYNQNLHAAQLQWFITVQNRNMQDDGYGEYFWFGLSFFDTRHEFSPHFSAKDANTTGMFIYMPDMKDILAATGKTQIGKTMQSSTNVLPIIEKAFELAKSRGFMQKTNKEDLYIASTNMGWEVPGTYNVSATIRKLNIYYR